jgi:hypothetical protein
MFVIHRHRLSFCRCDVVPVDLRRNFPQRYRRPLLQATVGGHHLDRFTCPPGGQLRLVDEAGFPHTGDLRFRAPDVLYDFRSDLQPGSLVGAKVQVCLLVEKVHSAVFLDVHLSQDSRT